jgi:hypothetical protein
MCLPQIVASLTGESSAVMKLLCGTAVAGPFQFEVTALNSILHVVAGIHVWIYVGWACLRPHMHPHLESNCLRLSGEACGLVLGGMGRRMLLNVVYDWCVAVLNMTDPPVVMRVGQACTEFTGQDPQAGGGRCY